MARADSSKPKCRAIANARQPERRGAKSSDLSAAGKSVASSAKGAWIREALASSG